MTRIIIRGAPLGGGTTYALSTIAATARLTASDAAFEDVFNVEDYGAVHNGSTDDTGAINDAIAAASAAWTSGSPNVVYLPAGTYNMTDDGPEIGPATNGYHACVILQSNVIMRGAGVASTKLLRSAAGYTAGIGTDDLPLDNWGIEDLRVSTTLSGTNGDDGIKIFGATNGAMTNVTIAPEGAGRFHTPFMFYGCQHLTLTDCASDYGRVLGGFSVDNWDDDASADNTDDVSFIDCTASRATGSGMGYGFCVYVSQFDPPAHHIADVSFDGCIVENGNSGFYLKECTYPTIINCQTNSCTGWQYYILNTDNLWFPYPSGAVNKDDGTAVDYSSGGSVTERGSL